jgi:hypothetical protein
MQQVEEELRDLQREDQKNEAQVALRMKKRARKSTEKQVQFYSQPHHLSSSYPYLLAHVCCMHEPALHNVLSILLQAVASGKRPFFLKRSDARALELAKR